MPIGTFAEFAGAEPGGRRAAGQGPDPALQARSGDRANGRAVIGQLRTFTLDAPDGPDEPAQAGAPSTGRAAISRVRSMSWVIWATRASGDSKRRSSRSRWRNSIRIVRP